MKMTTNENKPDTLRSAIGKYLIGRGWLHVLLIVGLVTFCKSISQGFPAMLVIAVFPLAIVLIVQLLKYPKQSFYGLFGLQFLLVIAGMYTDIKLGAFTLALSVFTAFLLITYGIYERINYAASRNGMLLLFSLWGLYCLFEIVNPNNVMEAWNVSIPQYLIYPLICAVLVPLAVRNIKGIEWLLLIWSVFILIAAFKGYWQKSHGFNEREMYFLFTLGGAKTHIIWSGIRFFSCFSDATNFGIHMAMAVTCFGISIFYVRNFWLKAYMAMIIVAAIYGMGISGTRAAMAIPFGGIGLYILLSRNLRVCILGGVLLLSLFCFFRFTNIGDSNNYMRRMRTAFTPTADASYQVRVINRERMKQLMAHKPIGYGLGLSKGDRFYSRERMPYPPDSWLVSVWVETGIIGLVLYLLVHGVLFAWCSWILMLKIMDKRLRGLLVAWLCMNAGFFVTSYSSDIMQYPSSILVYTGFALCFAGPYIDKQIREQQDKKTVIL